MDLDKLFDIDAKKRAAMPKSLMVPLGIDTHVHGRTPQDGRSQMVIKMCAGEYEAIIDIPNVRDVSSGEQCLARRIMLEALVPEGKRRLNVYCTPLINDDTDPAMLKAAWKASDIAGIKIFWKGVSNAYGQYITSIQAIERLIAALPDGFVVTVHAECLIDYKGRPLEIKDREYWCIINELVRLIRLNPKLVYIVRHVSDYRTLQWIEERWKEGYKIYAEISPQYLIQVADDIFKDDDGHAELQCDCLYWPRPKDPHSRKALQASVLRCPPWLIWGSDLAVHLHDPSQVGGVKINNMGKAVGGLTFRPAAAKSVVIDFCVSHGKPENLRKLLVDNPSAAYGIKLEGTEVEYVREDWTVPDFTTYERVDTRAPGGLYEARSINFLRGKTMHWKRAA